jgi:hypothetical protein
MNDIASIKLVEDRGRIRAFATIRTANGFIGKSAVIGRKS